MLFPVIFQPLSWSLLSSRTSPVVQYRVYCTTTALVKSDHIIWRMNGTDVVNSSSTIISHQLLDAATYSYTNILTMTIGHRTQTISCAVNFNDADETDNFRFNLNVCVYYFKLSIFFQLPVILQ